MPNSLPNTTRRRIANLRPRAACALLLVLASLSSGYAQTTHVVDNALDATNAGKVSLREALAAAVDGDTIVFAPELSGGILTLLLGELSIDDSVTIDASALDEILAIDGGLASRIFSVPNGNTVTLRCLRLTRGANAAGGGGIRSRGTLALEDCVIDNCEAGTGHGGAIQSAFAGHPSGTLTLKRCLLRENSAAIGAAIDVNSNTLTLDQCTLTDNFTTGASGTGGGVSLQNGSLLNCTQSTLVNNIAGDDGGGIWLHTGGPQLILHNSIVAGNSASDDGNDIYGRIFNTSFQFNGVNFIGDLTGIREDADVPANTLTGDPNLGPLLRYHPCTRTATMAPLLGSPVIDASGENFSSFLSDARGLPRIISGSVDIGAVESQALPAATLLLREDFEPAATSIRYNSTWSPEQTRDGSPPTSAGGVLQLTTHVGNINNSIAWDAHAGTASELMLLVDFKMEPDGGNTPADGWGIGLFSTETYGADGAANPANNDVEERVWEDMRVLPCFNDAIALGLDVFNGADDAITFCSPDAGAAGAGALRFDGLAPFDLDDGRWHRMQLHLRESGPDTLASLVLTKDILSAYEESTVFANLVLPGLKLSEFPGRLIAGGRTGGLVVDTQLDNVALFSPAVVDTQADESDGPCPGERLSLREAMRFALELTSGSVEHFPTISFDPSLSGRRFTLGGSPLVADDRLRIDASALDEPPLIDADGNSRVFDFAAGADLELKSLVITGGRSAFAAPKSDPGGGIFNEGTLTLSQCTVTENEANPGGGTRSGGDAGGIYNSGSLTLLNSTVANNTAGGGGAAGGEGGSGGGIYNTGELTLFSSTVADNSAGNGGGGGGGFPPGEGGAGGGIYSEGPVTIVSSTIAGNSAGRGEGGRGGGIASPPNALNLTNTVIAGNRLQDGTPEDLFPPSPISTVSGINFIGTTTGLGIPDDDTFPSGEPWLAPLGDYGGPTPVRPPLPGSPLIDAGVARLFNLDQRLAPGTLGPQVDIGSVEAFAFCTLPLVDSDNDGIDDRLEPAYPEQLVVGRDDSAVDSDGDGQTDADELKAMTDPLDPNSRLRILSITPFSESHYQIEWTSFPGLDYLFEIDTDLDFSGPGYQQLGPLNTNPTGPTSLGFFERNTASHFLKVRVAPPN